MKTYSDYMKSITKYELYKGLMVYGMFAEKLPPVFSVDDFWQYSLNMEGSFSKKDHDYIYFESIKNNGVPRPFGLPTPMAYQRLCKGLTEYWPNLQEYFYSKTCKQKYKVSRIHLRKIKGSEKVFEMNYKKWWIDPEPQLDLMVGAKYVVRSDISTCFPSIYTHSIPWALIGKEQAKANKKNNEWYNKIDALCRATKSGETHGVLIGPHASNLISEIILCSVDESLSKYKYVRNIDDFECYVSSYEEGERFISDLNNALRLFDLPLNRKKTKIEKLPLSSAEHWVHQIKNALLLQIDGHVVERKHIQSFLDTVVQLADTSEDAAAIKYAMSVIKGKQLDANALEYYLKMIMHA